MRILHLSDTHIERSPTLESSSRGGTPIAPDKQGVHATDSLRLMLTELRHQRGVDAIVVTGDLANDGAVEAYTTVRVGDFARRREAL